MQAFGPTRECTPLDELTLLLEGRRGEECKRGAQTHVEGCSYCRTELSLLHEFEAPVLRAGESDAVASIVNRLRNHSPAKPVAWWSTLLRPSRLIPASVGLAAMALALMITLPSRQPADRFDIPAGAEVMRFQGVQPIGPMGDLTAVPGELSWQPFPGASRYTVRLMEVDRTELWTAAATETTVKIPTAIRDKIVPQKTLLWQVNAFDPAGNTLASSSQTSFRLQ